MQNILAAIVQSGKLWGVSKKGLLMELMPPRITVQQRRGSGYVKRSTALNRGASNLKVY